jgi:hypothetical protein
MNIRGEAAGKLASKALRDPGPLSEAGIKTLAASVLTQRPGKPKPASKAKPRSRCKIRWTETVGIVVRPEA